jgi:hypothetical protein
MATKKLMTHEEFNASETPFNLAGELLDEGITQEGERLATARAESEARKAQTTFEPMLSHWWKTDSCRQAFERAKSRKRESLQAFLDKRKAHEQELDAEIWKDE